jgi:hypothetical protein
VREQIKDFLDTKPTPQPKPEGSKKIAKDFLANPRNN